MRKIQDNAVRQMPRELHDLVKLKLTNYNKTYLQWQLFTTHPTLNNVFITGKVSDLLLYRIVKFQPEKFSSQKHLEFVANLHFAKGNNGLCV